MFEQDLSLTFSIHCLIIFSSQSLSSLQILFSLQQSNHRELGFPQFLFYSNQETPEGNPVCKTRSTKFIMSLVVKWNFKRSTELNQVILFNPWDERNEEKVIWLEFNCKHNFFDEH